MIRALIFLFITLLAAKGLCDDRSVPKVEIVSVEGIRASNSGLHILRVRFTNNGEKTLYILAPLDGSTYGILAPFYRFTIRKDDGQAIKPLGGMDAVNGLWGGTSWPDDYLIAIRPGDAYELRMMLWIASEIGKPIWSGTIEFEYSMPENPPSTRMFPYYPDRDLVYPAKVWRGTASSKQIRFGSAKEK